MAQTNVELEYQRHRTSDMNWIHWADAKPPPLLFYNVGGTLIAELPLGVVLDPASPVTGNASQGPTGHAHRSDRTTWPWSEVLYLLSHLFPDASNTPLLVAPRPPDDDSKRLQPLNQENEAQPGEYTLWLGAGGQAPPTEIVPSGSLAPSSVSGASSGASSSSQRSVSTT